MPKRNAAEHSANFRETYQDEQTTDDKQAQFDLDHPPDEWCQNDFSHQFTDELKAIDDSGKSLTDYSADERKALAFAAAEAFRSLDFDTRENQVEAAKQLSHSLMDPVAQEIRLQDAQLDPKDIELLSRAGGEDVPDISHGPAHAGTGECTPCAGHQEE